MAQPTALKTAIFNSGRRQIEIAAAAGIHETRLSKIANGWEEASDDEKDALAVALQTTRRKLFPKQKQKAVA